MAKKVFFYFLYKKGPIAKALCNYLLYVENNPKKALELASEAT